jgi:hypothetical protein
VIVNKTEKEKKCGELRYRSCDLNQLAKEIAAVSSSVIRLL